MILQEGQTIPGDCQLICDYNVPEDFEEYKRLKNEDKFTDEPGQDPEGGPKDSEKGEGKEVENDDDDRSMHFGLSLIACGKPISANHKRRSTN